MISSKWSEKDAKEFVNKYASTAGEDLALRIYSSRLIGVENRLVMHGGGNTSVKSIYKNILGKALPAIFVKGSGWDLAAIEPEGFPGLDLDYLRQLRAMPELSDEVMVNELRTHMFNASQPTPSVETLLHAFLPAKFIDHSHANAILAMTNNRDWKNCLKECFSDEVILVDYVMPGFALAKRAAEEFDKKPGASAMILLKHGLFTWGETARDSYEQHISILQKAEKYIHSRSGKVQAKKALNDPALIRAEVILPLVRGLLAEKNKDGAASKRFIFDLRNSPEVMAFVNSNDLGALSQTPPLTPDHIIRTKQLPLLLDIGGSEDVRKLTEAAAKAVDEYEKNYNAYFNRVSKLRGAERHKLDAKPRVILIPGLGMIGAGETRQAARIAADLYQETISVKQSISEFSSYEGLDEADLFDVEYWGLEQAKLGKSKPKALAGQVALVTGGCGAIGIGVAQALKAAGAEVVIADISDTKKTAEALGIYGVNMDVTSPDSVQNAFKEIAQRYGGIDIVVPNAGIAASCAIEEITPELAKKVFDVNLNGYLWTIQEAARYLKLQNTGGNLIIISSKNVAAPGKDFSLYSASKAGGHQLGRVAAIELAPYKIRVNMVAPDAVFGNSDNPSGLWQEVGPARAASRGIEFSQLEEFYQQRNLLKTKVSADDVGRAVVFFASNQTPTTAASLAVDGGI